MQTAQQTAPEAATHAPRHTAEVVSLDDRRHKKNEQTAHPLVSELSEADRFEAWRL